MQRNELNPAIEQQVHDILKPKTEADKQIATTVAAIIGDDRQKRMEQLRAAHRHFVEEPRERASLPRQSRRKAGRGRISSSGYKRPSALKHGAYSTMTMLPGEDPQQFIAIHEDLKADFNPQGPEENYTVLDMARYRFRLQNLAVYQKNGYRLQTLASPGSLLGVPHHGATAVLGELRAAVDQVAEDLIAGSLEGQMPLLQAEERLQSLYDRCFKRLMMLQATRGLR